MLKEKKVICTKCEGLHCTGEAYVYLLLQQILFIFKKLKLSIWLSNDVYVIFGSYLIDISESRGDYEPKLAYSSVGYKQYKNICALIGKTSTSQCPTFLISVNV